MTVIKKISNEDFAEALLSWWNLNKREFPWRHSRNPYEVLVAEMLLRKTTASQVLGVYSGFVERYPNARKLAGAKKSDLVRILKPLGMEHERARLFRELGEELCKSYDGEVPRNRDDLLLLPGVGDYSANAVLCMSMGSDLPMFDTNFARVVQRYFGLRSLKKRVRQDREMWAFAQSLLPKAGSRAFNLAVLDFAALVCKARKPDCHGCPISFGCFIWGAMTEKP